MGQGGGRARSRELCSRFRDNLAERRRGEAWGISPGAWPCRGRRGGLFLVQTFGLMLMRVSVSEAKGQLTDLVRRAEAGDEVVLTRHGQPVARLSAIVRRPADVDRRRIIEEVRAEARAKVRPPTAGSPDDFLYGEDGLPR